MAKGYYVRIDTYWQNSPDRWVGPFATATEAQAEIDKAVGAYDSKVTPATQMAADVKHGIRVLGIAPKSQAQRRGLKDFSLGDDISNIIGNKIPLSTDDLFDLEQMLV